MERQIEEDQAKIAEDSDGKTRDKYVQAFLNLIVTKTRITFYLNVFY